MPWIWTAITLEVIAAVMLLTPIARNKVAMSVACAFVAYGIWIEKGMGLIIPAFVPSPIGEIVEYVPTLEESLICFGIGAFGLMVFTILVRISIPVLSGRMTVDQDYDPNQPVPSK